MSLVGKIQSLFLDREKTQPIFPITKVKAVSDDNGKGLNVLLDDKASKDFVTAKIAEAQLGGGSGGVDLSGFATKDDLNAVNDKIPTTPEQIGAHPNTWIPTVSDVGAAPAGYGLGANPTYVSDANTCKSNGWFYIDENTANKPKHIDYAVLFVYRRNYMEYVQEVVDVTKGSRATRNCYNGETWSEWIDCGPSAFAPAGYGLGEVCPVLALNDATKTGWYKGSPGYVSGVPHAYYTDFWYCGHIEAGVYNGAIQRAYYNPIVYPNSEIVRTRNSDSTWSEWEWVDPPMSLGVEYRTTERWNGKTVWKIALDFGALPNNGQKHIAMPINGLDDYVRIFLKTNDGNGNHRYIAGSSDSISVHILEGWKVVVSTSAEYGGLGGIFEIHYTKH